MSLATENLFPLCAQPFPDEELTAAEARDVLLILGTVSDALMRSTNSGSGIRRRLDAIAGAILSLMDELEGDCDREEDFDREAVCEDEGSQCDDEGEPDDNGIADDGGLQEQWSRRGLSFA